MEVLDRHRAIVADMFRDHVAEWPAPTVLIWRKPGSGNCYVHYDLIGPRTLCVTGDLGAAVYAWSGEITFKWLAGLDLSYFVGKCEASENGREFREWDYQLARARFDVMLREAKEERPEHALEIEELQARGLDDELFSAESWARFADEELRFLWEDLDGVWGIGYCIALRAVAHHDGLRRAIAAIADGTGSVCGAGPVVKTRIEG